MRQDDTTPRCGDDTGTIVPALNATSETLLARLVDAGDQPAWERFYQLYAPLIVSFSLGRGCTRTMAWDVVQETMVRLMRQMPEFRYNPGRGQFRSWLLRVVQARIADAFRRQRRVHQTLRDSRSRSALGPTGRDDPGEAWEREWQRHVLRRALERVQLKVSDRTFQSFSMSVLGERPPAKVAAELGIERNTVYQHRNRVMKLVLQEAAAVRREMEEDWPHD